LRVTYRGEVSRKRRPYIAESSGSGKKTPVIELKGITRSYVEGAVRALDNVSLKIEQGEFVAIIGASGSGKSTLMHVLGLLDRPDSGSYTFLGRNVTGLSDNELAMLRNRLIGFVFQQFHLLPKLTAAQNVCLPLIYSGKSHMREVTADCIKQVGLGNRIGHRPNQLSGGEQQRVAIARALVNEPLVIMADEPTGNLDSKSREEIVAILQKLNREGKTIIMVTHEKEIAEHAGRVITMRDGRIVSDTGTKAPSASSAPSAKLNGFLLLKSSANTATFADHFRQALSSLVSHKTRSFLSMLGILIGVAAVIAVLAVTQSARDSIKATISSLGSNLLLIFPGSRQLGGVRLETSAVTRLTLEDVKKIAELPTIRRASPSALSWGRCQVVFGNKNWSTVVQGTGVEYAEMHASVPPVGRFFTEEEIQNREKVVVLGLTVAKELFGDADPIGKIIKIIRVKFKVIGVLPPKGVAFRDQDDVVIIPVTTAMHRILGHDYVDSIDVEVCETDQIDEAQDQLKDLMARRHKITGDIDDSIQVRGTTEMRDALSKTTRIMSWLLGSIAAISLIVGGIGIMNIMLVSVTERTREIGLRKAVGARGSDIMTQFLVEAIVMTFLGGLMGIALGSGAAFVLGKLASLPAHVAMSSVVMAVSFSVAVGLIFGLWPARQAAKLDPIEALRYE
jgi:macrolide transport system ATP-binding/permease protein